jgi:hypothetical protein
MAFPSVVWQASACAIGVYETVSVHGFGVNSLYATRLRGNMAHAYHEIGDFHRVLSSTNRTSSNGRKEKSHAEVQRRKGSDSRNRP